MKLYVYEHCPFCVKARMIFGLKNVPVEISVLANDDEKTPVSMVGQKMVPILQTETGGFMPESMDIVHYIDKKYGAPLITGSTNPAIAAWLRHVNEYTSRLLLPRFARANFEEFATPEARRYFVNKKEATLGSFDEHLQHSPGLIKKIGQDLHDLDKLIVEPNAVNGELSEDDFSLFPLLRSLTIVNGVTFPTRVAAYRDNMAKQTQVNLLSSIAQ
ncbi:glutaredoxin, GrxB family [Chimaeribacter arupi]|uniref:Glutaredoxin, GrxB family n=2 Tax=Yersiniaceae TaxID=1903411 RepID=A0A2N5ERI2_9GAMM|nr:MULTISPECIES: glutaredoxin 2 [Yersiniaceae]MBS0967304.1 glutaredoxin 2 [Nissabacter archeti]MDV5139254.1 glutaredoxin 2 [Chimaeribacter arupi]PLR36698.1 glutaredoxin, GrxB family [Chimaeribacter arupi]PLR48748.1 glutaredoxin, GrxB family [Chimaeribacter arupi]PLR51732.1 glutaredoxin, GrxB family [Chimaeribacter arupi]